MSGYQPLRIIGFHSCDKKVGIRVLNGEDSLLPSQNKWDWLGDGIYFWEEDPVRAWEYASESSQNKQYNKIRIEEPFVLGAIIDLGNCLNLVDRESLKILAASFEGLASLIKEAGKLLPTNKGDNRMLDCAVLQYINQSNLQEKKQSYDTIRCAFPEGKEVFPGSSISSRLHMQICVRNPDCIKGFFLPRPLEKFNPLLQ